MDKTAEKRQIQKAVEKMYNVHVTSVTTSIVKGKRRIVGKKRKTVIRPDRKKAFVKIAKGDKIAAFEVTT